MQDITGLLFNARNVRSQTELLLSYYAAKDIVNLRNQGCSATLTLELLKRGINGISRDKYQKGNDVLDFGKRLLRDYHIAVRPRHFTFFFKAIPLLVLVNTASRFSVHQRQSVLKPQLIHTFINLQNGYVILSSSKLPLSKAMLKAISLNFSKEHVRQLELIKQYLNSDAIAEAYCSQPLHLNLIKAYLSKKEDLKLT
ncbi:hypothetical protein HPB49_012651 [Dermacentor silvarum]|uniref:Uncharacterized protein n=1 Tax=Dermacentor silvarum TaxID=543639 RepID=A0ACB8C9C1_DERSI|nr:hypothetical protein HPB49_012651 [Dermacentor silvarum]